MRKYKIRVFHVVYIEEFGNFFKPPYFRGKFDVEVEANSYYEAESIAIEINRKKLRGYSRYQNKAIDENKIWFNAKLLF